MSFIPSAVRSSAGRFLGTMLLLAVSIWGTANSAVAAAAVTSAPKITTNPANHTVDAGQTVTFSAVATGTPSPTLQWSFDGTAIPGATASTLTLSGVQPGNAGSYTVTATNSAGHATSAAATLTVDSAPAFIVPPPANAYVDLDNTATISVAVTGNPTPTLQWFFNGVALTDTVSADGFTISGSVTATLTFADVDAQALLGTYSVVASNGLGTVTSSAVNLGPEIFPVIDTEPADTGALVGQTATFSVVAEGSSDLAFQWFDPNLGGPIPGATDATLIIPNVQAADSYFVTVTDDLGFC